MIESRRYARAAVWGIVSAVTLTACDGGSRLTGGDTPPTTITLDLNRADLASLRASHAPYKVEAHSDHSITVSGGGRSVRFKGKRAQIDGRVWIQLTDRAAAMIGTGIREMEYRQSEQSRTLLNAAARCITRSGVSVQSTPASASLAMPSISTSFAIDAPNCTDISLALHNVSREINAFWDNFWNDAAGDVFRASVVGTVAGYSAGLAAGATGVAIPLAFDIVAAGIEYEILLLQRDIVAGMFRAYNCF
jgi:hypothetical protein